MGKAARLKREGAIPVVTSAFIKARLTELRQQHAQALANANAIAGAIALCEQFLAAPNAPASAPPNNIPAVTEP